MSGERCSIDNRCKSRLLRAQSLDLLIEFSVIAQVKHQYPKSKKLVLAFTYRTVFSRWLTRSFPPCFSAFTFSAAAFRRFSYSRTLSSHLVVASACLASCAATVDCNSLNWLESALTLLSPDDALTWSERSSLEDSTEFEALYVANSNAASRC